MELQRALELLKKGMPSDRLSDFYADASLREAHLLSYVEVLEIFGSNVDYEYLPEANKRLIQSHFLMQNTVHDQMRKYQFGPLLLRVLRLARRHPSSRNWEVALAGPSLALGPRRRLHLRPGDDLQLRPPQTLPFGELLRLRSLESKQ